jgi:endonuclease/exonuclease/phosphatase family metal-dependent hydrolase
MGVSGFGKRFLILLVGASAGLGCASEPPPATEGQYLTEAQAKCAALPVRAVPVDPATVAGLEPTGSVPFPSLQADDTGTFHPGPGYLEGGTFPTAADSPAWALDPEEIWERAPEGALRVVEWNVERGQKIDAVIREMKRINADVWLLNESDLYGKPSGGVVVAREIARALGYSYVTGTEFTELRDDRRGSSGDAIVSRYPIREAQKMDTPIFEEHGGYDWANSKSEPRCGQRSALRAVVDVATAEGARSIPFVVVHLENKANAKVRKMQYEAVVERLVEPGAATILGGDFNTVSPFEGAKFRTYLADELEALGPADAFFDCSRGDDAHTFSAALIVNLRIDWMLLQAGDDASIACPAGSYDVLSSGRASDHRPVLTEFAVVPANASP